MCGIAGFIDFKNHSSRIIIEKMTASMHHRGPDGFSSEFFEASGSQIAFGHKRLSIIDLTDTGKQPMQLDDLWVTFNGEIYNFKEIKVELEKLGHSFVGESDTEMILHAYQQWGEHCVDRFIGMFVIVIYDSKNNSIFISRDRAGVKPLFYYWNKELFLFSSELKALHQHPNFEKKIDTKAVAAYIQYGSVPTPHCIFQHTYKLKPGHNLFLNIESKKIETRQYWNVYDFYNKPKLSIDFQEAKTQMKEILHSAFSYRMVADVPVGVFLSGGYDSTCVTGMLQSERKEKLKTFTIGVPDIGLNEAPYAKDIAEHIGTDHTEIICSEKEAIEFVKELPFFYDEPFADSSAIPTSLVSKIAKQDVTVALSADGGDEIFAGYNRYDYMIRYGKQLNAISPILRSSMVRIMNLIPSEKIPILRNKYNFHNRYEKLKGVLKNPTNQDIMLSLSQQFTDSQMRDLMKFDFGTLDNLYHGKELKKDFTSPLSFMMAIDFQTYLLDDILQKVDRATMSQSLEGREPMLDHRILEFTAQLPDEYKYHRGVKKRILKDIVHDYVPEKLLDRPKMGFAIPIAKWLNEDLREYVETYICKDKIEEQEFFNWEYISSIKDAFYNGRKEYDTKIWYILMFQMWYEKWM